MGPAMAADALLRTMGCTVKLRVPADGVPQDAGEQLGLAVPEFRDETLGPVVFLKARTAGADGKATRYELLVSASAVLAMVSSLGFESVAVLFGTCAGVLVGERLLFVESCTASEARGEIYCYRIGLRGPLGVVV